MIPGPLLSLSNHLWQSTLFAAVTALLTLILRRNRAQIRYSLWLAASAKFLIPFSVLVMMGSRFAPHTMPAITPSGIPIVVQEVIRPFVVTVPLAAMAPAQPSFQSLISFLSVVLWATGFVIASASWWRKWRQIRTASRAATPLRLLIGVEVMSSSEFIEPGVFGIRRPVLLLPEDIVGRLTPPELDAILAHELCHIRRRDNLAAALHMAVEALFWFHPLVWWLGARLLDERERACDEEVLRMGSEPAVYAEGILKICELYAASPLSCAAGVTGGNLGKRIEEIMANRTRPRLSFGKKLLLASGGMLAVTVPVVIGMAGGQLRAQSSTVSWEAAAGGNMAFDTVSVRRWSPSVSVPPRFWSPQFPLDAADGYASTGGRFAFNLPLVAYIAFAYKISLTQSKFLIAHLPQWATDFFEIQAQAKGNPTKDQMRLMVQSLLADRFRLAIHFETQLVPVFALTLVEHGKLGRRLHPHEEATPCPVTYMAPSAGGPGSGRGVLPAECDTQNWSRRDGTVLLGSRNATMAVLAGSLPNLSRPVVDQTGLNGKYDFTLEWLFDSVVVAPNRAEQDLPAPDFLDALREQLGLKLESTKGPVQILVIDRVEKPSEN